jgi:archaemetzincin
MPFCRGFKRPSAAQSRAAIDTPRVQAPPAIVALRDSSACPPAVPTPQSEDDWLAQYVEEGQTMAEFLTQCPWISRRKRKYYRGEFQGQGSNVLEKYPGGKICLLPLGDIRHGPSMEALREYTEAFYRGMEVCVLPPVDVEVSAKSKQPVVWRDPDGSAVELAHRRHGKQVQLQIDAVLLQLRSVKVEGALMVVAVTMHELFDGPTDLFVAGMASGLHNVAVFSFTRYHPLMEFSPEFWWKVSAPTEPQKASSSRKRRAATAKASLRAEDEEEAAASASRLMLQRCCKLLVHEVGHLLGVDHCIHFACCMNGSGHLEEDFAQPSFLCPVCLHKAYSLFGFNVADRYSAMADFFGKHGLAEDEAGARRLLEAVAGADGGAGPAAKRVRGRPVAAGPSTIDLTVEQLAEESEDRSGDVICLHSPVASVHSAAAPRGGDSARDVSPDDEEDEDTMPLAERLAKRMRKDGRPERQPANNHVQS